MTLSFVGKPDEIVATDNSDASDSNIFSSLDRKAFNDLALVIIKAKRRRAVPARCISMTSGFIDPAIFRIRVKARLFVY